MFNIKTSVLLLTFHALSCFTLETIGSKSVALYGSSSRGSSNDDRQGRCLTCVLYPDRNRDRSYYDYRYYDRDQPSRRTFGSRPGYDDRSWYYQPENRYYQGGYRDRYDDRYNGPYNRYDDRYDYDQGRYDNYYNSNYRGNGYDNRDPQYYDMMREGYNRDRYYERNPYDRYDNNYDRYRGDDRYNYRNWDDNYRGHGNSENSGHGHYNAGDRPNRWQELDRPSSMYGPPKGGNYEPSDRPPRPHKPDHDRPSGSHNKYGNEETMNPNKSPHSNGAQGTWNYIEDKDRDWNNNPDRVRPASPESTNTSGNDKRPQTDADRDGYKYADRNRPMSTSYLHEREDDQPLRGSDPEPTMSTDKLTTKSATTQGESADSGTKSGE